MERRIFLKSSGLALVSYGVLPRFLVRAAYAEGEAARRKKALVVVFQRGACDGLNTVIPFGDSQYRALRPTIAVPAPKGDGKSALALDDQFGLHPALAPLLPLWQEGSLAAIHAIGSPDATRSHFDAQDFMESGTPGKKSTDDGWMNRALLAQPDPKATPFRAVSLTPTLPRSLQGKASAVALSDLRGFDLRRGAGPAVAKGFEDMYAGAVDTVLHGAGRDTFNAVDFLKKANPGQQATTAGADYPRGRYGDALRQIAQLLKSDVGVELAFAEIGGWDTHAGQGGAEGQLAQRHRELAGALAAFHKDMGQRMSDVVVVTLTEFGRTARENGNRGTDHGHASVSFVMGGPVRGGKLHGRWPGLAQGQLYEGRDLALTTDFRDLLGELLTRHMGMADLRAVFPGHETAAARFPGVLRS
jgi:uncharacterized protein (DUF1501 family)